MLTSDWSTVSFVNPISILPSDWSIQSQSMLISDWLQVAAEAEEAGEVDEVEEEVLTSAWVAAAATRRPPSTKFYC